MISISYVNDVYFLCADGGARSFRRELEDCSDEDSDDEDDEDISLHCYILPSGSKSSFYFVKRKCTN